ncbi:unnamed protein product [Arctia plantaginis]|uniref:Uncharacterized protein n=1 Tax=Arctia plantaginis TaxID=874455 RepID=A0A8S0YXN5_ARCPL|nr:unnamed protein product [Arctia plantaginis]CAB3236224.1 unnamed protein product [Arctia plantaginis]
MKSLDSRFTTAPALRLNMAATYESMASNERLRNCTRESQQQNKVFDCVTSNASCWRLNEHVAETTGSSSSRQCGMVPLFRRAVNLHAHGIGRPQ